VSLPSSAADLNLSPQRKREKLFQALLNQLETEARHRPVLMVFEDAHWIDPTSRELLDLILAQIDHLPVLLAATFRPEFQPPWAGQPYVTVMSLNRLGRGDGEAMVERLAGNAALLPPDVIAEIVERTDGVPLFVEEMTKAVLEAGAERGREIATSVPRAGLGVPATLQASLMERLDRLGAAAKGVAQIGAAIGREFSYELAASVAELPEESLQDALQRLVDAGLVFRHGTPPAAEYLFKHALVQDAAYSTLLRGRRQELHSRIGKALEDQFPETVATQPEILAHHFTQAVLVDPAIKSWQRAGARSVSRSAHHEAAAQFRCALDLLEKLPPSRERNERELELTLALAVPLIAVHGFGSASVEECAVKARTLSDNLPGLQSRFAARRLAWNSCLMRQPLPRAVALAQDLFELAENNKDPAKLALAHRALGYSLLIAGELRKAGEILDRGIALADALSDHEFAVYGEHPGMVCRAYGGQAKILMGFLESGARLVEEAVAHARSDTNAHGLAWALGVAAHISQLQHEPATTIRFAAEAIEKARENRLPQWLALGERSKGWAMHRFNEFETGLNLQQEGVRRWYETGAALHTTHCEVILAESFLREGQTAPARNHLDRARAHRMSYGEEYLGPEIERLEAVLLQYEGAADEIVEECLAKSSSTARRQGARLLELRTATTLARVLVEKNQRHKALDILAPVYGWFTDGFDTADLKEAKALLDELR
jgi:hypothetical protein